MIILRVRKLEVIDFSIGMFSMKSSLLIFCLMILPYLCLWKTTTKAATIVAIMMRISETSRAHLWYGRWSRVRSGSGGSLALRSSWVMERLIVVNKKLIRTKMMAQQVFHRSLGNLVVWTLSQEGISISILTTDPFLQWRSSNYPSQLILFSST